jgi:hypothetical protein
MLYKTIGHLLRYDVTAVIMELSLLECYDVSFDE